MDMTKRSRINKEVEKELKRLGISVPEWYNLHEDKCNTTMKKAPKLEGFLKVEPSQENDEVNKTYKVLECGTSIILDNVSKAELLLCSGDLFELTGDDINIVNGSLYKKGKIIKSYLNDFNGCACWINIDHTTAPKMTRKKSKRLGRFEVVDKNIVVRDCKDLSVLGSLNKGDTVDTDEFNDFITSEEFILRKVIIRESKDESLINKTVWMPISSINKEESVGIYNTIFTVNKDCIDFDINLDGLDICQLDAGDTFLLTDSSIQFCEGLFYKEIKVLDSKDKSMIGKTGWIDLMNSDVLKPTIDFTRNVIPTQDDFILSNDFKLPIDMIGYKPNCNDIDHDNTTFLAKGLVVTVFDEFDCNDKLIVQCNMSKVKYAISASHYFKSVAYANKKHRLV